MPERIKRPKLARTSARRSLATLFTQSPNVAPLGGAGPLGGEASRPGEPWNDVVARSVELGYRVIDDYIRQGERIAGGVSGASFRSAPWAPGPDGQDVFRRMSQYAADFTTLWLQMLQGAAGGMAWPVPPFGGFPVGPLAWPSASRASGSSASASFAQPPSATDDRRLRVTVAISSQQPTEVVLELKPDAGARKIAVQSLRSADAAKPRLTEVQLTGDGAAEPFVLRVVVPPGQPPGVYNGMVIDEESGLPLGTLSLRVKAA